NRAQYTSLVEALRPVRDRLIPPLSRVFRDRTAEEKRFLAVSILAEYARDDLPTLTEVFLDSDPRWFSTLSPLLARHRETVIPMLERELNKTAEVRWSDSPLPMAPAPLEREVARKLEGAKGMVTEQFDFCQTLPLAELPALAERLRPSGYRPTRVRPYADGA